MNLRFLVCAFVSVAVIASCKKNDSVTAPPPPPSGHDTTAMQRINDTAIQYSHQIYLWNTQIPDTMSALSYAGPTDVMTAIRKFSKEPGYTDPVDHYSFAMKIAEFDNLSNGVSSDFGLNIFFLKDGDLRVRFVDSQSPADKAGIRRGWRITKINGNTTITIANANFITQNVYQSTSSTITFLKPDGTSVDIPLTAASYQSNPVYLDTVYSVGAKKAGYMVFSSFFGDTNAIYNSFQQAFSKFATQNITDLIIDLRYNSGGNVDIQKKFADYIIKSSANGSKMMTLKFNANYSNMNETTNFQKLGSLDINNVFFIVGGFTASASELLINNLKPYMNVKLIGATTYGKPVGFFPISIADWYIFPISFKSVNSNDEANYFTGMTVDKEVTDGIDKDFGDVAEARLSSVLTYINTGTFGFVPKGTALSSSLQSDVIDVNNKLRGNSFIGEVVRPRNFKK